MRLVCLLLALAACASEDAPTLTTSKGVLIQVQEGELVPLALLASSGQASEWRISGDPTHFKVMNLEGSALELMPRCDAVKGERGAILVPLTVSALVDGVERAQTIWVQIQGAVEGMCKPSVVMSLDHCGTHPDPQAIVVSDAFELPPEPLPAQLATYCQTFMHFQVDNNGDPDLQLSVDVRHSAPATLLGPGEPDGAGGLIIPVLANDGVRGEFPLEVRLLDASQEARDVRTTMLFVGREGEVGIEALPVECDLACDDSGTEAVIDEFGQAHVTFSITRRGTGPDVKLMLDHPEGQTAAEQAKPFGRAVSGDRTVYFGQPRDPLDQTPDFTLSSFPASVVVTVAPGINAHEHGGDTVSLTQVQGGARRSVHFASVERARLVTHAGFKNVRSLACLQGGSVGGTRPRFLVSVGGGSSAPSGGSFVVDDTSSQVVTQAPTGLGNLGPTRLLRIQLPGGAFFTMGGWPTSGNNFATRKFTDGDQPRWETDSRLGEFPFGDAAPISVDGKFTTHLVYPASNLGLAFRDMTSAGVVTVPVTGFDLSAQAILGVVPFNYAGGAGGTGDLDLLVLVQLMPTGKQLFVVDLTWSGGVPVAAAQVGHSDNLPAVSNVEGLAPGGLLVNSAVLMTRNADNAPSGPLGAQLVGTTLELDNLGLGPMGALDFVPNTSGGAKLMVGAVLGGGLFVPSLTTGNDVQWFQVDPLRLQNQEVGSVQVDPGSSYGRVLSVCPQNSTHPRSAVVLAGDTDTSYDLLWTQMSNVNSRPALPVAGKWPGL